MKEGGRTKESHQLSADWNLVEIAVTFLQFLINHKLHCSMWRAQYAWHIPLCVCELHMERSICNSICLPLRHHLSLVIMWSCSWSHLISNLVSGGQTLFPTEGKGLGYGHRATCRPTPWSVYQSQHSIQSQDTWSMWLTGKFKI